MLSFVENVVAGAAIGVGVVLGEKAVTKGAPYIAKAAVAAREKATEAKLRLEAWYADRKAKKLEAAVVA